MVLTEEIVLEGLEAFLVVIPQRKTCGSARAGNLEFIDDFLPELPAADFLGAAADVDSFEKLAEVQFATADRGDFEVVLAHLPMKSHKTLLELGTLLDLVLCIQEFELVRLVVDN